VNAKTNDFKIGLFVVFALGLLLAALFIFGASKFFERQAVEETYVSGSVEGLKEGAPVLLRGVPVGEVTRINFTWNVYHRQEPRYVLVEFDVRRDVVLEPKGGSFAGQMRKEVEQGLRARIKSQGLVGASVVSLEYLDPRKYPPLPTPWKPRHVYIPSAPGEFSEILASLDKTMKHIQQINVQALTTSLRSDLAAAEHFLNHLDQANVGGVVTNANALVTDLRQASGQIRAFVGQTSPGAANNLVALSDQAAALLARLEASVNRLNQMLANFDYASLNQIIENAREAAEELRAVLRELKTYPAGVLFGRPPPPAQSVEPPRK
jgi:phospholipid/cholesterol/gamma-HCH transport system substrate-binding protein